MGVSRRGVLFGAGTVFGGVAGALLRGAGARGGIPLRPPGALPEAEFLAACTRCGQCVSACPFDTLVLIDGVAGPRVATPTFDPARVPCYLCQGHEGLECIAVCPTAALSHVPSERDIRIGTAEILHDLCFAYNGVLCRSCWHACPYPDEAIVFDERLRPIIVKEACIGCGLCTRACPTEVNAIPVRPREAT